MSSLAITLIQSDLHWQNKQANMAMFEEKILSLPGGEEIVVLPEMFSTGFSMEPAALAEQMDGPTVQWMKKLAAAKKIILTGSIIIEDDGHYFNRMIWMLPNGQMGTYDKRHLFAFAGEDQQYKPGSKRLIASVKGWKINLQVCYDLRFPVWARQTTALFHEDGAPMPEYDVLVYVANWPERRNVAWKTLLQARAIENQCYVVGVNRVGRDGNDLYYSGDSMLIDPGGEILYQKAHDEDIASFILHEDRLDEVRKKLPFLRDADNFKLFP